METNIKNSFDDKKKLRESASRKILSSKIILAHILKETLTEEYNDYTAEEIAEKYIETNPGNSAEALQQPEDIFFTDETSDIAAHTEENDICDLIFDVTNPKNNVLIRTIFCLQKTCDKAAYNTIFRRAWFYTSLVHVDNFDETLNELIDKKSGRVMKIVSFNIILNPYKDLRNSIHRTELFCENTGIPASKETPYDNLDVAFFVGLGDKNDDHYEGVLKMLDVIFAEDIDTDKKKAVLANEYGINLSEDLEKALSDLSHE